MMRRRGAWPAAEAPPPPFSFLLPSPSSFSLLLLLPSPSSFSLLSSTALLLLSSNPAVQGAGHQSGGGDDRGGAEPGRGWPRQSGAGVGTATAERGRGGDGPRWSRDGPGWSGGGVLTSAQRRGGGAPVCVRALARCGVGGESDKRRRVC